MKCGHPPGREFLLAVQVLAKDDAHDPELPVSYISSGLLSFCPEIFPYGCKINDINKNRISRIFLLG